MPSVLAGRSKYSSSGVDGDSTKFNFGAGSMRNKDAELDKVLGRKKKTSGLVFSFGQTKSLGLGMNSSAFNVL